MATTDKTIVTLMEGDGISFGTARAPVANDGTLRRRGVESSREGS